jgi:flagellar hook-associated protein 1 FlgK
MQADAAIARDASLLNNALQRIETLNSQIVRIEVATGDANALRDQRQAAIDSIAAIVPLRQVDRQDGQVALFTPGGAVLLDGSARDIGFTPTSLITPQMTLAGGALSGLQIDGRPVDLGDRGPIGGGRLAANFALRDTQAPAIQAQLDGLARDLVERFQTADATLPPDAPGLFTDAGGPFDPVNEFGLSARLSVNALADPEQGGALSRLRDGLGAAAPGFPGDARQLQALSDALTNPAAPSSTALSGAARSVSGLAAHILSGVARARVSAEAEQGFSAARHDALRTRELEGGVDTDAEMANLLRIEQAFAANAQVIQAVDEMLQLLLRR